MSIVMITPAVPTSADRPVAGDDAPRGLYLHVPFCETKCGYCDFYSVPVEGRDPSPLVDTMIREIGHRLEAAPPTIETIFIGGGTPTILAPDDIGRLLDAVRRAVATCPIEEFTVEANPATVNDEKADLLLSHGVTRVSMGAQSFFPAELATLERLHTPDDIAPSVEILRRHGVGQINLDLIFGIPGQTLDTWSTSLQRAMDLRPDHLACYGLTFELGTRLTAQRRYGRIQPCDESLEADMYLLTVELLEAAGYAQYEISNYARPGCACRHNLIYWRHQPFIGIGPSAAGYVGGRRYRNVADVGAYVQRMNANGHAEAESESIIGETLIHELLLTQLRLNEGLSLADFARRTGLEPRSLFQPSLGSLIDEGLVTLTDTHLALTRRGRLVGDAVLTSLACTVGPTAISLPILA